MFEEYKIRPSKHFVLGWMRKWDWDIHSIRAALERANIKKVGKNKFEAHVRVKQKTRKLIFVRYEDIKELFIITGAEGGKLK